MPCTSRAALAPLFVLALGSSASGCDGFSGDGPLETYQEYYCTTSEFRVGEPSFYATDDPRLGALMHIISDLSGVGAGLVEDVARACGAIAEGLDAPRAARDDAGARSTPEERMIAQCSLAADTVRSAREAAGGSYALRLDEPICGASVPAYATCQRTCSADPCDPQATPITCDGGVLVIACQGACSDPLGSEVACWGRCDGTCEGACTSESGVECAGPCRGTCRGEADGGVGDGIRADGTCHGLCEGTCEVTATDATCDGSCDGSCSSTCRAEGAAATCNGSCDRAFEPLRCEGGSLGGGCALDPACAAACGTDARADAVCTLPVVQVVVTEPTNPLLADKLRAVLEAHLPTIATSYARASGIAGTSQQLVSAVNADTFADIDKVPCIPEIIGALFYGVDDVEVVQQSTEDLLFQAQ